MFDRTAPPSSTSAANAGSSPAERVMRIAPLDLRQQRFRTRVKGFDPTEVVAFLTDGFIGNETQILREVHDSLRDSRIFSFGVGSSPNRYLLDHMAQMGAGAAAYLSLQDNADQIMAAYFERISHPALTDISVDYGTMQATNVYPQKVPDLFVGRPVILTGRFNGNGETNVRAQASNSSR